MSEAGKHDGVRALVTGASGFIGGRLAERLAREDGAQVTGTGRRFPEEASLRAAGVKVAPADLQDEAAMARLCEGQQVLFHVAAWLMRGKGGEAEAHAINVEATRRLLQAAAQAGVQRVVLVSSVAIYGLPAHDDIDETTPPDTAQVDLYGRSKALGELAAQEVAAQRGLSLRIVRPAMVYGPRSAGWTVGMLKLVQRGVPVLFGDASGHAFPVYVDDVVDLLRLAGSRAEAAGEAFNAADRSITWAEFFGYYGRMCGRPPRRMPMALARGLAFVNQHLHLGLPLTVDRLRYYTRRLRFPTTKAERLLGYRPQVPLIQGMQESEAWLRRSGLLR